jgi:anti-anti-sigma factor
MPFVSTPLPTLQPSITLKVSNGASPTIGFDHPSVLTGPAEESCMTCHEANGVAVLTPHGHLHEGEESDRLEAGLARLLERHEPHIVVDLERTDRLSARAVGVIADAYQRAGRRGGRLTVRGATSQHRHVFEITGLAGLVNGREVMPVQPTG